MVKGFMHCGCKAEYVKNGKGIKNDCIIVTKENMV